MSISGKTHVGKIRDAHGLSGELFAIFFSGDFSWLDKAEEITLEGRAPNGNGKHEMTIETFKIKSFKPHKKGAILKVDGLTDRTQAEAYIGFALHIKNELLSSKPGETIFLNEIDGFEVFNNENRVGVIVDFSSNGAQDILVVKQDDRSVEIPLVSDWVKKIDWDNKQIKMILPEGLTDE